MENNELYPELKAYLFLYCGNVFWRGRAIGKFHLQNLVNSQKGVNIAMYKILTQGGSILNDPDISELTNDGYEAYQEKIATRIFKEHKDELELNLCPKCSKITRTPQAKQCRFCFHNWH